MIDQVTIANLLAHSHGQPVHGRARNEDDFYDEFGRSFVASFAAWLASFGSQKGQDRASPARSCPIASNCAPARAGG
jgi:hypothetical protein